jgi:hypothetical protein
LGKIKGRRDYSDSCQEKRPAHACRTKKALPANEGALGRKEKSGGQKESPCQEKRYTHACWAKEAFRANESALGSKEESSEVTSISKRALCRLYLEG